MKRFLLALFALAMAVPAQAQDKLVISIWGGSWRDLVAETVARKFTKETGVPVEFITGGTMDRLNGSPCRPRVMWATAGRSAAINLWTPPMKSSSVPRKLMYWFWNHTLFLADLINLSAFCA